MSLARQVAKLGFAAIDRAFRPASGPRVLIYHRVGGGDSQLQVSVADFAWQMEWLGRNRRVVTLDEALTRWDDEDSGEMVAITFDDGFADTFEIAYPLLAQHEFPFTLFVATGIVGLDDWEGRGRPLTWEQIEQMAASELLTIGSHTHTHADLRRIPRIAIESELSQADDLLEQVVGERPRHFAYPWGYWSAQADPIVRSRYESAWLGSRYVGGGRSSDHHLLHRVPIQLSDGRRWFSSRLRAGLLVEESVRRVLRGYKGP